MRGEWKGFFIFPLLLAIASPLLKALLAIFLQGDGVRFGVDAGVGVRVVPTRFCSTTEDAGLAHARVKRLFDMALVLA